MTGGRGGWSGPRVLWRVRGRFGGVAWPVRRFPGCGARERRVRAATRQPRLAATGPFRRRVAGLLTGHYPGPQGAVPAACTILVWPKPPLPGHDGRVESAGVRSRCRLQRGHAVSDAVLSEDVGGLSGVVAELLAEGFYVGAQKLGISAVLGSPNLLKQHILSEDAARVVG